jgi:hypothetical protein
MGLATELPPIRSCLETWSIVMQAAREVRQEPKPKVDYFAVRDEKYSQEKGEVKALFGDYLQLQPFVDALRAHDEIFADVQNESPVPQKDGRVEIAIKMEIKPKEAAESAP